MQLALNFLVDISWQVTILIVAFVLSKQIKNIVNWLKPKEIKAVFGGIELLISEAQKKLGLDGKQLEDLHYLNCHDIWALDSVKRHTHSVSLIESDRSLLAMKIAAIIFLKSNMAEIKNGNLVLTNYGNQILEIANNIKISDYEKLKTLG